MLKSKKVGGPIIDGSLQTYIQVQSDVEVINPHTGERDETSQAQLTLPNSFRFGDGAACGAVAEGITDTMAIEHVCKKVFVELLVRDAIQNYPKSQLVMHQIHWNASIQDILAHVGRTVTAEW